jgi:hypothetical protein
MAYMGTQLNLQAYQDAYREAHGSELSPDLLNMLRCHMALCTQADIIDAMSGNETLLLKKIRYIVRGVLPQISWVGSRRVDEIAAQIYQEMQAAVARLQQLMDGNELVFCGSNPPQLGMPGYDSLILRPDQLAYAAGEEGWEFIFRMAERCYKAFGNRCIFVFTVTSAVGIDRLRDALHSHLPVDVNLIEIMRRYIPTRHILYDPLVGGGPGSHVQHVMEVARQQERYLGRGGMSHKHLFVDEQGCIYEELVVFAIVPVDYQDAVRTLLLANRSTPDNLSR